ncbi:ACT domain-containing protein [Holophaga foetida]|uniref:ACT domain-containing protein n=1 Tax=Holophaga foetida TaxID=35839 RepID=UPI00024749DA|nr:ACT domain-containing protein [Holophaga foetida]
MKITQLSVFAENRPGRLQEILGILAKANINIQTLTIAEVTDFGILRLIVDRPEEAYQALKAESVTCSRTDVLAIVVENKPGALFRLMEAFSKHQLNIEYMYAYANPGQADSIMIFRFENLDAAQTALLAEGIQLVPRSEIHDK